MYNKSDYKKTKLEHHILPEFAKFLLNIEKYPKISRIIPGRINRQQKGSSNIRFRITTPTSTGFKCIMSKGSTAQELFIIGDSKDILEIKNFVEKSIKAFLEK